MKKKKRAKKIKRKSEKSISKNYFGSNKCLKKKGLQCCRIRQHKRRSCIEQRLFDALGISRVWRDHSDRKRPCAHGRHDVIRGVADHDGAAARPGRVLSGQRKRAKHRLRRGLE